MNVAIRKVGALCAKDVPDLIKNPVMIISVLMPIVLVFAFKNLYGNMDIAEVTSLANSHLLIMGVCMTVGMVPSMIIIYSLAEEKEKHTLRTLMLANVGASQVLAAKTAVAVVVAEMVNVALFFIMGASLEQLPSYVLVTFLGMIPMTLFSLLLGLVARDQMSAGLYSMPVLILSLLPVFGLFEESIERMVSLTPCGGMYDLLVLAGEGVLFTQEALLPLVVTVAWIIGLSVVFGILYKRFIRDN